ncbi:hypothetical protein [Pararhodobacter oceanensis]|uniref:hypothetical protein n=1 Tax=Pararhodobacter oceanensis TaxID=2172121 RepID=UPI003A937CF9
MLAAKKGFAINLLWRGQELRFKWFKGEGFNRRFGAFNTPSKVEITTRRRAARHTNHP